MMLVRLRSSFYGGVKFRFGGFRPRQDGKHEHLLGKLCLVSTMQHYNPWQLRGSRGSYDFTRSSRFTGFHPLQIRISIVSIKPRNYEQGQFECFCNAITQTPKTSPTPTGRATPMAKRPSYDRTYLYRWRLRVLCLFQVFLRPAVVLL